VIGRRSNVAECPVPGARNLGDGVFSSFDYSADDRPMLFHDCRTLGRWHAVHMNDNAVEQRWPLTLSGTVVFACCGLHGSVRDARWRRR
jgi:hypothetical protein